MSRFFLMLLLLICSACSMNHGKPAAKLSYSGVEELEDTGIYQVRFRADVEILELFKSHISQGLVCAVDDDLDFSVAHQIKRSGFGLVERDERGKENEYKADVIFRESTGKKGAEIFPEGAVLSRWFTKRPFISCVFRAHTTPYKTYFSEIMRVPSADLARAINRE
ncbi:hypothetical protein [Pseudomonas hamedanensis]|uniref:Lipoprotein n=1 Tax=Pseudomonas hamedanensis TaxID=2745504 RepID=A0A9E6TFX6_9PSED|nr:hypothetical protein [Pseudomonas hamedanensis]QXI16417.1 hypothetical protein HU739_021230 [Pseudomonas hamedanensis]